VKANNLPEAKALTKLIYNKRRVDVCSFVANMGI